MAEEETKGYHPADTNGDGIVTDEEQAMYLEFKRKEMKYAIPRRRNQKILF